MSYEEKRVTTKVYGTLSAGSELLVPVPTTVGSSPQRLHKLAAHTLDHMAEAVKRDLGIELRVASGWRAHRWKSREEYERTLIAKYGSVEEGRRWLAFDSPHETGLAADFGCGGLEPRSATADEQRKTPLSRWLVEHAWEYGWHPYKAEPWHWEFPAPLAAYRTGVAIG